MIVTILRHGKAGPAPIDSQRTLTARGSEDIAFGGEKLSQTLEKQCLPLPGLILYSEWTRTTQTAELISPHFPLAKLESDGSLVPGGTIREVDETLRLVAAREELVEHVMLVSHQPLVSELADYYLGYPNSVPGLSPGALFSIQLDVPAQDCASLLFWAAPPYYETER